MYVYNPELKAQGKFPIEWRYRGRTKAESLEKIKAIEKAQQVELLPIKINHASSSKIIHIFPKIQKVSHEVAGNV